MNLSSGFDHSRPSASGWIASLLALSLIAWPMVLHTGCEGGSTGVDNPGLAELPVEFRDEAGNGIQVRGELAAYHQSHNPALDSAPLWRRQVQGQPGLRLTADDFEQILAASDSLIRFNLIFRGSSGAGAMATGLSFDPALKLFFLENRAMASLRMRPKPLFRFAGILRREAIHGVLGRIILPGTPFQATLADSGFVLDNLIEGRFPMRLLGGDGYLYAVRESLDTRTSRAFTAETNPIGRIDGILPPAGFGVEAGTPLSVYAGEDAELRGQLLGADSSDSRISIRWRFLDKAPGDSAFITDPTRLLTLIRFPDLPGYSLELAATLGAITVRDTFLLNVSPPPDPNGIKFLYPQSGDTLVQNQPAKVTWENAAADQVRLEFSYKEDVWSVIADSIADTSAQNGYAWTPPLLGSPFHNCFLRLKAIPSDSVLGVMPAPFSLIPAP